MKIRFFLLSLAGAALSFAAQDPVVMDAAFSQSAHGKIRVYQQKGLPIPPSWAFDTEGRPTTEVNLMITSVACAAGT